MHRPRNHPAAIALACLTAILALLLAGCGGGGGASSQPAPSASEFPSAKGKTIGDLFENSGAKQTKLVIAPAAQSFVKGPNRYPFGVFTVAGEQVEDADVAMYFARSDKSKVIGPYPAHLESLETKPAYRAQTSGAKGDARSVYVVPKVNFSANGPWLAIAMLKGKDGLEVSRVPSATAGANPRIPEVGQAPPRITTLTAADVGGDLEKIDTRIPPDQMHKYDFAEVLGKKPIVLVFATPALCQSRVCGPVVDVAQQVADKYEPRAAFIHQEVYVENDIAKGIRPQLKAFGLETEPWTFLVGKEGIVKDRIEGAYGVAELEQAMKTILPG
ncbi:MAG: hypothetical protein JST31_12425 [Actinobacteria bacterium]|nr:hypothetical protein [Actinomycetota bacterium]